VHYLLVRGVEHTRSSIKSAASGTAIGARTLTGCGNLIPNQQFIFVERDLATAESKAVATAVAVITSRERWVKAAAKRAAEAECPDIGIPARSDPERHQPGRRGGCQALLPKRPDLPERASI